MAKNNKPATDSSETTITRVKAKDDTKPEVQKLAPQKAAPVVNGVKDKPRKKNVILRFLGYFKGAWYELRQVRWPNRRASIGMTAALLVFAGLFGLFIFVVDLAWENLFKLILG